MPPESETPGQSAPTLGDSPPRGLGRDLEETGGPEFVHSRSRNGQRVLETWKALIAKCRR